MYVLSYVRGCFSWLWAGKVSFPYHLPPTGHRPLNCGEFDADYIG